MFGRYILVGLANFTCTVLFLKSLDFILPYYITSYFYQVANFILCVIIAKFAFGFSKKLLLRDQVQPDGKAVLITGCARGIGNLLAKQLDSEGFTVFASCRSLDSPGADDLRKNCSDRLKILQLDVTKDESVQKALQFVKENLGISDLWAVINNAGIQKGFHTELTGIQDFVDSLEVNAIGHVRISKAFLPLLRKSRGRVINITSLAGRLPIPMCGPYTMSKYASIGFTEGLRIEMEAWGVRVISIESEFFETDMAKSENILERLEETLSSSDEEVRKDYGEEYMKKLREFAGKAFPPSPHIQKLLNDINSAVILKNPDAVYQTYRNVFMKFILNFFISCSPECRVLLANAFMRILGMPKPEKAFMM